MPDAEKVSVSLPPHRAEYLRKKSAKTGIPISHLIEGALAELERLEILDELLEDLTDGAPRRSLRCSPQKERG